MGVALRKDVECREAQSVEEILFEFGFFSAFVFWVSASVWWKPAAVVV
jgi:hypothetical protein